jgi:hypothetical protein
MTLNGTTAIVGTSDDETDLAVDGVLGFDYAITPQISLGGRYRLVWINVGSSATGIGVSGSNDDFIGHVLTANFTWHF